MIKAGFIGTGNMGSALATTVARNEGVELLLANRTPKSAEALAKKLGGKVTDNITIAYESDLIFLGVKPQNLEELALEIRDTLKDRKNKEDTFVIISMIAGKTISQIEDLLGFPCPIVRFNPNIANMVQEGMTIYTYNQHIDSAQLEQVLALMRAGGRLIALDEEWIAAGAGVSSCGPAFAAMFIDALADAGVACGLTRTDAVELAAQMIKGTATYILEKKIHPGALKDMVCSPAGTTIQGVRKLEQHGFRSSVMEAVIATCETDHQL